MPATTCSQRRIRLDHSVSIDPHIIGHASSRQNARLSSATFGPALRQCNRDGGNFDIFPRGVGHRKIRPPSLRGALATKQSILSFCGEMDCFVALLLAMTL